jgi:hypothetical protein
MALRTEIVLFSNIRRDDIGRKQYSEGHFSFLDRSARPAMGRVRELLERWLSEYPREGQPELCRRIQSGDDEHFNAAVFELYIHQILLRTQHRVEIHRGEGDGKRPDFFAKGTDGAALVLEAIVATEASDASKGGQNRLNQFYDITETLESADFRLHRRSEGEPKTPLPSERWLRELKAWIASLDYNAIALQEQQGAVDLIPELRLEHDGLTVTFTPFLRPQGDRGQPHLRMIASQSSGAVSVRSRDAIKRAVKKKASRYGRPESPYLIAIDGFGESCDREEFRHALYGPDGLWKNTGKPTCTRVSGVLAAEQLMHLTLGCAPLYLFHNPFAARPYSGSLCKLPQARWTDGRVHYTEGISAGRLLGLPEGWPHVE